MVIFTKEKHDILTDTCRWTIIGKFSRTRPAIDIIRAEFNNIIQLKGTVKIGAFDLKHVFIDVEYEEDYESLSSRNYIHLEGDCIMQLQKWTPFFKPAKRNSIAPVWITLPDLSWQFFEWDALCRIVNPIGYPLIMDKATSTNSRPTTAKLRVELDLAKPRIREVAVEIRNAEGGFERFTQKVEYEDLPEFCRDTQMISAE
ncbi:hypothetical protein MTR67_031757 [Solanum verrucosum]|uniref:DUF4283 domain-containing protein n=1 Tax=Solanum verrucosum TaxID=315347 RepID=A0AAF0ZFI3_SOLVR|nr:hypothetical protein MTR67_031757 [Solanum verrucosum]